MPNVQRECLAFIPRIPGEGTGLWFVDSLPKRQQSQVIPNGDQRNVATANPDGQPNQYFVGFGFFATAFGDIAGSGWDGGGAFNFWVCPIGSPNGAANTSAAEVGTAGGVGTVPGDVTPAEVTAEGNDPTTEIGERFENFEFNEDAAVQQVDNQVFIKVPWVVPQD